MALVDNGIRLDDDSVNIRQLEQALREDGCHVLPISEPKGSLQKYHVVHVWSNFRCSDLVELLSGGGKDEVKNVSRASLWRGCCGYCGQADAKQFEEHLLCVQGMCAPRATHAPSNAAVMSVIERQSRGARLTRAALQLRIAFSSITLPVRTAVGIK